MTVVLWFIAGLIALVGGAELFVRGAAGLAAALRISPLVIGLTVVAFGTSAPELAVSLQAAGAGQPDIALGNVVGSNIFNVLLILGLAALIAPLTVNAQLVRIDVPLMIGASILVFLLGLDGRLGRVDGLVLFSTVVLYTLWLIRQSRRERGDVAHEYQEEFGPRRERGIGLLVLRSLFMIAGLALLVVGSRWLIDSAVNFARTFGVGELMIGLTIVAGGTSLPEVATSVIASLRGQRDIAVGNVVGSNLFNLLCVLGLTATVSTRGITVPSAALRFDLPVMMVVALACLPIFASGHRIARWEGALFVGYQIAYTTYLVFAASASAWLDPFTIMMVAFAIPLTALTLIVVGMREWRVRTRDAHSENSG